MLQYDFENSPGWWIASTAHAIERAMAAELRPLGITYRQCLVLATLALHGPVSQADLARELRVEPPTLAGVVARMERDGWVERRPCPTDARKNLVHPGPEAERVWNDVVTTALPLRARAVHGFTGKDLTTLRDLLSRVRANLSTAAPAAEETPR